MEGLLCPICSEINQISDKFIQQKRNEEKAKDISCIVAMRLLMDCNRRSFWNVIVNPFCIIQ